MASDTQLTLNLPASLPADAYSYGARTSGETHGVVLTKPHVVDLILDLASYTSDRDLGALELLDPACGHGAFLLPAVSRLLESARLHGRAPSTLMSALTAFDIDESHVAQSRAAVAGALARGGVRWAQARDLAQTWISRADFLLATPSGAFDVVVGNPPYIRIEQVSETLQAEYRARYASLFDRADLYVAFIEQGLNLLGDGGILSFICADRWTLNKYGGPLRRFIAERFGVRCYVDLHQASPFESDVIAYPAIFAIGKEKVAETQVAALVAASPDECRRLAAALPGGESPGDGVRLSGYASWFEGDEPWILSTPEHLDALRALEERFAPIEADGATRVGIGVATGNDGVYIVDGAADIEEDRLVPLVMREDIKNGQVGNGHRFVINTFGDDGKVVNLRKYPRLARYFDTHHAAVTKRYVSRKNPANWFRTIDRVYPELVGKPKLLIPDIAGSNEVVFDKGEYHPHHNLYFVTSGSWDMEILGGLLSSRVALFFVWSYAVKMRGDYLRFQAQYLRRIRLPAPNMLAPRLGSDIREAFRERDFGRLDALALDAYGLRALPDFSYTETRR